MASVPGVQPPPREWRRPWIRATLAAALATTACDAVLLQLKKAFFTGGFLAPLYTRTMAEAAGFLLVSLAADAAVAGVLAAVALWVSGRAALTARARLMVAFLCAAGPLLLADVIQYRLLAYLGDAFDFSLMFDLVGRRPAEIFAVSAAHLVAPLLLAAAGCVAAACLVWLMNRGRDARRRLAVTFRLPLVALMVLAAAGAVVTVARELSETLDDGLKRKPSGQLFGRLAALVTDLDRDGYALGGAVIDPAPFDARIHPYALDVPGNGIDEDALAGDLPAGAAPYTEGGPRAAWVRRPDVVLIVLESFRADALGRLVNGRPVTPVLDALARRGVSTPRAFSHNGYTAQSRFHIFSGSLAHLRGRATLIDDFKANGYEVGYFSGQDDSFGGATYAVGMGRADVAYDARQDRDQRYSTFTTAGSLAVPLARVQEKVFAFLESRSAGKPLFLYVNFHDTHYPYRHAGMRALVSSTTLQESDIAPANAAALREMYFNAAANVDAAIGATLEAVARRLGGEPAVIVLSDHGESLFDEGFLGHGYALNDVQTRIPLVAAGLPLRIAEPFGQSDLRDAIVEAMSRPNDEHPVVIAQPDKRVFQYLGRIDAPRQIAFTDGAARTIYDFRTRRAQVGGGPWVHPSDLPAGQAAAFRDLVHMWERMALARARAKAP